MGLTCYKPTKMPKYTGAKPTKTKFTYDGHDFIILRREVFCEGGTGHIFEFWYNNELYGATIWGKLAFAKSELIDMYKRHGV